MAAAAPPPPPGADADGAACASSSSWGRQASSLAASLAARGFDLAHPFSVAAYNEGVRERYEAAVTAAAAADGPLPAPPSFLPMGKRRRPPALLVGNTGAVFWESFLRWTCASARRGGDGDSDDLLASLPRDPLDAFVVAAVKEALAEAATAAAASSSPSSSSSIPPPSPPLDVRFSHVVRPADRFVDVLRAAAGSGMAYFSIAAHLCAHPTAGPFFSLRAAVVLDAEEEGEEEERGDGEGGQGGAPPPPPPTRAAAAAAAADDADVERLMEASARAAEAAWEEAAAAPSPAAAAAAAIAARGAVRELWLRAYGRAALSAQRPRAAPPFSAEEEERAAAMYRALFAGAAAGDGDGDGGADGGGEAPEGTTRDRRPWREEDKWRGWAEARAALGGERAGARWRFSDAQIHYHYTRDREGLRRELERVMMGSGGAGSCNGEGRKNKADLIDPA